MKRASSGDRARRQVPSAILLPSSGPVSFAHLPGAGFLARFLDRLERAFALLVHVGVLVARLAEQPVQRLDGRPAALLAEWDVLGEPGALAADHRQRDADPVQLGLHT